MYSDVQLRQDDIVLRQGAEYTFEFDAGADSPRVIEALISKGKNPSIDIGKIGPTYITTHEKHYSYTFTMVEATVFSASAVVNCGGDFGEVYIDNLSLKEKVESGDTTSYVPVHMISESLEVFPNPAVEGNITVRFYSGDTGGKLISVYNLTGQMLLQRICADPAPGWNEITIPFFGFEPGIYILKFGNRAGSMNSSYKKIIIK